MDLPCTESERHGSELQGTEWRGNMRKGNGVESEVESRDGKDMTRKH